MCEWRFSWKRDLVISTSIQSCLNGRKDVEVKPQIFEKQLFPYTSMFHNLALFTFLLPPFWNSHYANYNDKTSLP